MFKILSAPQRIGPFLPSTLLCQTYTTGFIKNFSRINKWEKLTDNGSEMSGFIFFQGIFIFHKVLEN